ncbi:phospholipase D-like domain-containing protein [Vibrio splendidus]|uniref:phospholipase D-like domain-containing protein n=1 Tax=Vibrio splendidus TaxID=29497 RepID=UPI000C858CEF|nr:phospholipase D-like domain-containing protein [Vibrio splendidus]PMN84562.1 hypothetical protein BCT24_01005 [Vibrio splendidus]
MSGLISNTELTKQLEVILPSCKNLTIISAFMTQPATRWLSLLIAENKPIVQLVGRFTPNDFVKGSSDLNALRDCIKNGYQVKALVNLHAKIYQIDEDTIFNGSANLTGKGLALVNDSNLESCSQVTPSPESRTFINKIATSAIEITLPTLDKMEEYLKQFRDEDTGDSPAIWPEEILSLATELFVSDFPLGKPGASVNEYTLNPSLPFAQIEHSKDNVEIASIIFKQSKAYRWLKAQVKENKSGRDLGFGQVSRLLHDALSDDPAPYRQDVKNLQSNLYRYVEIYSFDEMAIKTPGRRSEVLILKDCN